MMFLLVGFVTLAANIMPGEVTWQIGKHDGHQITMKSEGAEARLTSNRLNRPESSRSISKAAAEKIWKDWLGLGLKPLKEDASLSCGDVLIVTTKIGQEQKRQYYCGDRLMKSQKLDFKQFYEKLLAVSTDPKKNYK